jgi:hypothetical protein
MWMIGWAALSVTAAGADTLSGRVTNASGTGVFPLDIDVYSGGTLLVTPGDTTNAQGNYTITLGPGTYDVAFKPPPGSSLFRRTVLGVTVAGTTTLNVTLVAGRRLSGRVIGPSGAGVPSVNLDFHDPNTGGVPANVQDDATDANGFFGALVDAAVWDVSFIAPESARVAPRLIPAVNLASDASLGDVALERGYLVQGTVTDDGFFPLFDADIDVRPAGLRTKLFTPQDNTDESGYYQLILPAGTFDITGNASANEPLASATARSITVAADRWVPNLMLGPAVELRGRCQDPGGVRVAGVDVDVDSLPHIRRQETDHDASDTNGDFRVLVAPWKYRVTLSPPVVTKLLPVRFDSLQIDGDRDLGTVTFGSGHWVSGTVVESGTGIPVAGANLDFIRTSNGTTAITPGDVTDGAGFFRVTTDADLYRVRVNPPTAAYDTLIVQPFRSLKDTTVTFTLVRRVSGVGVAGRAPSRLALSAPWPNPASGPVVLSIAGVGPVELGVWDLAGRRAAMLYRGTLAGARTVSWDGRAAGGAPLPAGVYLIRLTDGAAVVARRLAWLR